MTRPATHMSRTGLVVGDFALSAGWGATASIDQLQSTSSDLSGRLRVSASGAGIAAQPTITLTFKSGAFLSAPFVVTARTSGGSQMSVQFSVTSTTTTMVLTFEGTPVAGQTYGVHWAVFGGG